MRLQIVMCAFSLLGGCTTGSAPTLWQQTPPQTSQMGTVVRVGAMPTYNTSSEAQRNVMGMYGAAGALAVELLGTRKGYPVYRVKVSEDVELSVASREDFSLGDCVRVSHPAGDARRYFGLGEALIDKIAGCSTVKAE